jgi:hypothetical protein
MLNTNELLALSRVAAALSALSLALAILFYPIGNFAISASDGEHIEHARNFVDQKRMETGRLPTQEEFIAWTGEMDQEGYRYDGRAYTLTTAAFPRTLLDHAGEPPPGSYGFIFWTGDVFVTVGSWQEDRRRGFRLDSDYRFVHQAAGTSLLLFLAWCIMRWAIARRQPVLDTRPRCIMPFLRKPSMKEFMSCGLGIVAVASFVVIAPHVHNSPGGIYPFFAISLFAGYLDKISIGSYLLGIASAVLAIAWMLLRSEDGAFAQFFLPSLLTIILVMGALCFSIGWLARLLHLAARKHWGTASDLAS